MAVSLISLCLDLAYVLDDVKPYTVQSSTATTVRAVGLGNLTTSASTDTYNGAWSYVSNQQRRVRTGGYIPSLSDLTINAAWTSNPIAAEILYLTRLFPIGPGGAPGEDTPYKTFVVDALKSLAYRDIVTLAMTSGDAYALSAYPWLDRPERLIGIRESAPISGRSAVDASWRLANVPIQRFGTTDFLRLNAPFSVGAAGTVALDVMRPAFTLVNGIESTEGPTQDADTTEANPEDVRTVALAFAYRALMARQQSSPDGANWASLYATQNEMARSLKAFDSSRERIIEEAPEGRSILQGTAA